MGSRELSWRDRQLTQVADGENEISYAYNGDGQRVSKTVNGTTTEYFYNGELLAGQKTGDSILVFMYDNNGDIFGFIDGGTEYYYVKNAQNDVTAIASADGTIIANYYYDSWGQITEITGDTAIAELNPIRYRSYYYDSETEWYFLNTRYYSPELCRFINADGYVQTGQGMLDKNMFAYCLNNPVNLLDQTGEFAWAVALIVIAACTIIGGVVGGLRKTNTYNITRSNSQNNNSNSQNNKPTNRNKNNSNNSNNKRSSSKNNKNSSNTQSRSKGSYEYSEKLKPKEIAMNVFIGATVGLAVGGALVMTGGAMIAVLGNMAAAGGAVTLFGASTLSVIQGAQQAAAIGMLAYNLEAMVFGPLYFVDLEPIEWKAD